jgi:hypothetical protein
MGGREAHPLHPRDLGRRGQEVGQGPPLGVPVGVDGLPQELDLHHPPRGQGAHLRQHIVHGPADLRSARAGDHAIGAAVVAAFDHRHVGPARGLPFPPDAVEGEADGVVADLGVAGARGLSPPQFLQDPRQRPGGPRAQDQVHVGGALEDRPPLLLRHAAADAQDHVRALLLEGLETSQLREHLLRRLLPDGAGVEEHDVGLLGSARGDVSLLGQRARQLLGVVHVHLTAPGGDPVATSGLVRGPARLRHRRRGRARRGGRSPPPPR